MKAIFLLAALGVCAVLAWTKRDQPWPCLLGRHDAVLTFGGSEIYLRCINCQRRSDGWDLSHSGARRTV